MPLTHSLSISLKYFSFILVLYQFVLRTLRDINILSSPRKIFLSSLTRKIFSFLSSHKYICSRNLSPWLSLTSEWPDQDVTRPRVETRVGRGVTEARSPVTEPEPPEDTLGTETWWCIVLAIKLGCLEDKYRDYEYSFDPSNGNCVWLCCYYRGWDTLLWHFQDYSAYRSYEIGANICPVSWYMWPSIFPTNRDSHEPGPSDRTLHNPLLQFIAEWSFHYP